MDEKTGLVAAALEKASSVTIEVRAEEDPKHFAIVAHLAASKADFSQIAFMTGLAQEEVSGILALDRIQAMVREINGRQFARDPQARIRSLLPAAIDVQAGILDNPKAKEELRAKVADSIIDRAMGRAAQTIDLGGSAVLALLDRLDRIEDKQKIKTIQGEQKGDNEVEEGEIIVDPIQNSNPFQEWIDKNT